jgi:uncharacterized protein (TIGR03000 family)
MYGILISLALSGSGPAPAWGNDTAPVVGTYAGPGGYYPTLFPVSYAAGFGGIHGGCGGYFASGCHGWNGGCAGAAYSFGGGCYGYYISPYLVMPHSIPATTPSALAIREGGPVDAPLFAGHAAPVHAAPIMAAPVTPTMPEPEPIAAPKESTAAPAAAPGRVIVNLPADAKLFADGRPTRTGSAERQFDTPTLRPGREYRYELRMEVVRDGQVVTTTKPVIVRAGADVRVEFDEPARPIVRASAR